MSKIDSEQPSQDKRKERVDGNIFVQPWWLDAVAPGAWKEIVVEKGGYITARMPLVDIEEHGQMVYGMPKLTQTLGPWYDLGEGKLAKQLSRHKDLATQLIEQIPEEKRFAQRFHYSVDNWLPWYWKGFEQTTRYTYVLEDLTSEKLLWDGLDAKIRTDIKKGNKHCSVKQVDDLDRFLELNEMVFKRQGKSLPYSCDFVARLDDACSSRQQRAIFIAEGTGGKDHAGAYVVWDEESAYYLMGGGNPELRNSGATSSCMWEAIQYCSQLTKRFDFEGSMLEPVERFFRAFGATPKPYFQISKGEPKYGSMKARLRGAARILIKGR